MLSIGDYLIVLITNTSRKAHLLSCALRHSSKLQEIQSLENFISMAIKGTQVPIYTKHTLFLYFSDFSFFFNIYEKKKQKGKTENKQTKNMLNKTKHKTRLTQNKKEKQTSNANHKGRERKRD